MRDESMVPHENRPHLGELWRLMAWVRDPRDTLVREKAESTRLPTPPLKPYLMINPESDYSLWGCFYLLTTSSWRHTECISASPCACWWLSEHRERDELKEGGMMAECEGTRGCWSWRQIKTRGMSAAVKHMKDFTAEEGFVFPLWESGWKF